MKKQLLSIILALLPMLAMADDSGSCGDNVTYTFVSSTGTLTIQGSGAMKNSSETSVPWYSYRTNIKTVIIEDGVTSIGNVAFYFCSGLTSVTIPNSVTSIGSDAFGGCSGLTSVTIPNGVTSIGWSAFRGCSGLTSVTIPNSVTSIEGYAFGWCSGLTSITIPNSVTSIGDCAFYNCSGLTSVTMPNSVMSIGAQAFRGCSGLTSITIPNGVTSIGISAFEGCSGLTSVTIGSGIMKIDYYAFSCSPKLSTINVLMDIPVEINEEAFKYTGENYSSDIIYLAATLNVPIGRKNVYSNVKGWSKFANIQETEFTGVETIKQKSTPTSYYSVSGEKLNNVHHGVNIIRMSDGTTRKVVVK